MIVDSVLFVPITLVKISNKVYTLIMIAGIEFTAYQDYSQYLTEENDYEYDKALEVLNKQVKKLVENNELTFLYDEKRVNPILLIESVLMLMLSCMSA